jgi:hypothetical protein
MGVPCLAGREIATVATYMSVPCLHGVRGFHGNYINECAKRARDPVPAEYSYVNTEP